MFSGVLYNKVFDFVNIDLTSFQSNSKLQVELQQQDVKSQIIMYLLVVPCVSQPAEGKTGSTEYYQPYSSQAPQPEDQFPEGIRAAIDLS